MQRFGGLISLPKRGVFTNTSVIILGVTVSFGEDRRGSGVTKVVSAGSLADAGKCS